MSQDGHASSSATPIPRSPPNANTNRPRASSSQSSGVQWDPCSIVYPTHRDHPAPMSHPMMVMTMAEISNVPIAVTDDELFETILQKLESWVRREAEGGYVLIVFAAEEARDGSGKGKGRMQPGVAWWLMRWRKVPRHIRKGLKRMYLVHPSSFTRNAIPLILPLLSPKAYNKLSQLPSLFDLHGIHGVDLNGITLPLAVIEEEARIRPNHHPNLASSAATWGSSIAYALGTMGSYLSIPGLTSTNSITTSDGPARGYWDRSIEDLVDESGGKIPPIFDELREVIVSQCVTTEGIFRLTPNSHLRSVVVDILNLPTQLQPTIPWTAIANIDPLLPPKIISRLLSKVSTPLIPQDQYNLVRQCSTAEAIRTVLLPNLSTATRLVMTHVISTLHAVSLHSAETRMTPLNLAICIAPDLIRGSDPMEDAGLCMQSGRRLPAQMRGVQPGGGDHSGGTLVGLLEIWIKEFDHFEGDFSSSREPENKKGKRHSLLGDSSRSEPSRPVVT